MHRQGRQAEAGRQHGEKNGMVVIMTVFLWAGRGIGDHVDDTCIPEPKVSNRRLAFAPSLAFGKVCLRTRRRAAVNVDAGGWSVGRSVLPLARSGSARLRERVITKDNLGGGCHRIGK